MNMRLEAHDLASTRAGRRLFDALAFVLLPGHALRVAGNNGDGKTTLLRILAGLAEPDEGSVFWNDAPLPAASEQLRRELVYVGHRDGLKDALSVEENLREWATLAGMRANSEAILLALQQTGLDQHAQRAVRTLSQGQRRRVALARLVLGASRRLWILDEPLNALDASGQERITTLLDQHLEHGGMLVYTSHHALGLRNTSHACLELRKEGVC